MFQNRGKKKLKNGQDDSLDEIQKLILTENHQQLK